jgi:hypothetical protein
MSSSASSTIFSPAQSAEIAAGAASGRAPALMFLTGVFPVFIGTVVLVVAAVRAGVAQRWMPVALVVGWLLPLVSGTGLVPAVAGAALITAVFGTIGLRVARMTNQAWAERPARVSSTTRLKAPKIAVESAA